ncbi:hypothetical protein BsWGS_21597 [Bradybaena similaris]
MAAYSSNYIIETLKASRTRPLLQRCFHLEEILKTSSSKDLKSALPFILHEIFDFDKDLKQGWQLDQVYRSHNPELFHRVQQLLSPEGPLINVIDILQADPYATYEFPLACMPSPAKNMIEDGVIPPFYSNKLHVQHYSAPVLILNAFELFVFHLAYALVSPVWQARNINWGDLYEFVYPSVITNLLEYFLPCDKSSLPKIPHVGSHVIRPSMASSIPAQPYGIAAGQSSPPASFSGFSHRSLFKTSFIQAQRQHQQSMPVFDQAETEIWRSETFLQIVTEFWLNQNTFSGGDKLQSFSGSLQLSAMYQRSSYRTVFEHFMPTVNHVKIVRLLVKYLHCFANSTTSVVTSSYQPSVQSPLDLFKRSVIPHILQKPLYTFLRHAFERWPLDSCFRMVLETWLSFIQPWRYTDYRSVTIGRGLASEMESSKEVDSKWSHFVEDNLLFYTVLLREFVPRIYRMDLTSPYSAYMVYRVSRILSLPNLPNLILQAEQKLFGGPGTQADLGGSYLSNQSVYMSMVTPAQMMDLEGANFHYVSFFSENTKFNMMKVISQLTDSLELVRARQNKEVTTAKPEKSGLFSFLFGYGRDRNIYLGPEYRRLPVHLEQSILKLCYIFSIPTPGTIFYSNTTQSVDTSLSNDSIYLTEEDNPYPDCVQTDAGLKLTDIGRKQLMNREKKFTSFYVGDPDLQPVRSYENTALVRILFYFCSFINSYFSAEFNTLYQRQDFIGHFARVFLISPSAPEEMQQKMMSPISKKAAELTRSHQARITLRFLASYHTMVHIGIMYLVLSYLLGVGPLGFVAVLLALLFLYGALVACVRSLRSRTECH